MAVIRVARHNVEALVEDSLIVRVARQNVEALVVDSPVVRVARQQVEILGDSPIKFGVADSTLSLTDVAHNGVLRVSASSTLAMLSGYGLTRTINLSAVNDLELTPQGEYRGPISRSAFNVLDLSVSTRVPLVIEAEAFSTIELSQSNHAGGSISATAANTLELQHFADGIEKLRNLYNTISIAQTVDGATSKPSQSQLELSQVARVDSVSKSTSSTLVLSQFARAEPATQEITSVLVMSQGARSQQQFASATTLVELDHGVVVAKPILISVETELLSTETLWDFDLDDLVTVDTGLRQSVEKSGISSSSRGSVFGVKQTVSVYKVSATATPGIASNTLSFAQEGWGSTTLGTFATSTLSLSQSVTGDIGFSPSSTVDVSQSVVYSMVFAAKVLTNEIGLEQSVTYTLETGSTRCQYTPFVGESTDSNAPDPPPAAIDGPMPGIEVPFQLLYPSIGLVTDSVALKTPNLGNKDRLAFNRVLRETRGGTLIVFADPIWPKVQTLVLSFSGLLRVEVYELQTFINDHLGLEIGLIDWEHRFWRGVIVNPAEPLIEDRFDSFTTSFDFEGELDPEWNPQIVPISLRYSATRSERADGYYIPSDPILPTMPSATDYYTAIAAVDVEVGEPVYITGLGTINLAKADSPSETEVVGIVQEACLAGETCRYLTEGMIERLDWTTIAGASELLPGATYFLDSAFAGNITATAPTTAGKFVVRVGRAVDARTLDIEIELPILL